MIFSNINFRCSGNINEDLDFEYSDGTSAHFGCGATLHNVFWYFGGSGSNKRQVKFQKPLLDIHLFNLRLVKLSDASWSVKPI